MRKKIYFIKDSKEYQVVDFDKKTGRLVLRGAYKKFETTLEKAVKAGYQLTRK